MGITFNGYGAKIEEGLKQRIHALNEFVHDIYNDQKIIRDAVIPEEITLSPGC